MSFVVPPTPSHEEAADVLARLAQVSDKGQAEDRGQSSARTSRALLAVSCAFSTLGTFLLACSLVVMCAPQSLPGRLIFMICGTLA